jgi:hypothetical protein
LTHPSVCPETKRMNGDKYFVDSNVFLYIFDQGAPTERDKSEAWLAWLSRQASSSAPSRSSIPLKRLPRRTRANGLPLRSDVIP